MARPREISTFLRHNAQGKSIGWNRVKKIGKDYKIEESINANYDRHIWASDMFDATNDIDNYLMPRLMSKGEELWVYNKTKHRWIKPDTLHNNRVAYQMTDPYMANHLFQNL